VCWVLNELFTMPNRKQMVFKGGTSLSKVYNAIKRFSEDVDVTINYREFNVTRDPLTDEMSKTSVGNWNDEVRQFVSTHVKTVLGPYLSRRSKALFDNEGPQITVGEQGEEDKFFVIYPSALDGGTGYIPRRVLIELGARNLIEPNDTYTIKPDIVASGNLSNLEFPVATIQVLAAERTFWEKATLIYAEINRPSQRGAERLERYSRHWYDLAMLADSKVGERALEDRDLLASVVQVKSQLFRVRGVDYAACLRGGMRLVPDGSLLQVLEKDYKDMIDSSMFYEDPPSFSGILGRLSTIETRINSINF
jgi:hypothetical protein